VDGSWRRAQVRRDEGVATPPHVLKVHDHSPGCEVRVRSRGVVAKRPAKGDPTAVGLARHGGALSPPTRIARPFDHRVRRAFGAQALTHRVNRHDTGAREGAEQVLHDVG
jgi:hypothetical protein